MEGDQKRKKRRTRWGADVGDEDVDPNTDAGESDPPVAEEGEEASLDTSRSTPSKRRRTRWGGDNEVSDLGTRETARAIGEDTATNSADFAVEASGDHLGRAVTQPQPPPPSFSMAFGRPPVPPASFAPLPVHPNAVPPASSAQAVLEAGNAQTTAVHGHNAVAEALNNLPLTAVQSVVTDSAPGVEHHVTSVPVSGHAKQMASATEGNSAGDAAAEAVAQLDQQDTPMDVEVPGESNSDKNDAGEAPIGSLPPPPALTTEGGEPQAKAAAPPAGEPCTLIVRSIRMEANEQSLRLLFESAGKVVGCKLVKDADTGSHKGFGFVMMGSRAEAEAAVEKFDKLEWGNKQLEVTLKVPGEPAKAAAAPAPWTSAAAAASQPVASMPWSSVPMPGMSLPPPSGVAGGGYGYPHDPYGGAYSYYGYGYDPYAAYSAAAYASNQSGGANAEDEKPPGMEDEEAPPGMESSAPAAAPGEAATESAAPGEDTDAAKEGAEEPPAPPPSPPKKELTVIHVPLKIPEGARKKQEERKKAREEKAKQLQAAADAAADTGSTETWNPSEADAGKASAAAKAAALVPPKPVTVGTKGTFQEVLARRQAELAALKAGKAAAAAAATKAQEPPPPTATPATHRPGWRPPPFSGEPPPPRGFDHQRRFPGQVPARSRSPARRRNLRQPHSRGPIRPPSRSYSRSPPPSMLPRSPVRSRSQSGSPPSVVEGSQAAGVGGGGSASPSGRKEKRKSKDKKKEKRKHKKEEKRKRRARDHSSWPTAPTDAGDDDDVRQIEKLLGEEPRAEDVLPPALTKPGQQTLPEPASVCKPKRSKTRWHPDQEEGTGNGTSREVEDSPDWAARKVRSHRHSEDGALDGTREDGSRRSDRRESSPQVSEEGEIPLEEGEIEGEMGELPLHKSQQPPADDWEAYGRDYGRSEYPRYGGFRGSGRGRGRGREWTEYGAEGGDRYAEQEKEW